MSFINEKTTVEFENFIFKRMGESRIIGLNIATIKDGKVNYKRGFGFRDFDKGTSPNSQTLYCIGSVTKTFTALAIMQLQERGKLSLEDPITDYVPFNVKPMGEPIKIKHLLNHSSGLPSLGYVEATLGSVTGIYESWFPIASPEDLLVFMNGAEEWSLSKPGERHAYLNEGYILLGLIIEKASGMHYEDYVTENILKPLGMERSTYSEDRVKKLENVATPYITSPDGDKVATKYPYGQMIADGGLMSTTDDMVKYVKMMLNNGRNDSSNVVSTETIHSVMEPKIKSEEQPVDGSGYQYYGYGLRIKSEFLGYSLIYHSGSVYGSSAYINFIPEEQVGVVILANGGYFLEDIGEYALAYLIGRNPLETPYMKRTRQLEDLTGTYATFKGTSNYKVTRRWGTLELTTYFGQRSYTMPLIPENLDGETKEFKLYGTETVTPVHFIRRGRDLFLVYDRTMARRVIGEVG